MRSSDQVHQIKRKFPRKAFRKKVGLMSGGQSASAQGLEIGEGGLSFSSDMVLDQNCKMILSFFLSEDEFFSVRVTLLNSYRAGQEFHYGVSFDDVSIALKRQIRTYVARTSVDSRNLN